MVTVKVGNNLPTLFPLCRRYSYSAVGLNYLTSAVVMLEAIVLVGLVQQVIFGNM